MSNFIDNIELFNVGEAYKTAYGYRLYRYPKEVRKCLSRDGASVSCYSDACEIRFARKKGTVVRVTLMAENNDGNITVMYGDRTHQWHFAPAGKFVNLELSDCPSDEFGDEVFEGDLYNRSVVRIILTSAKFVLCDVECVNGEIRPPKPEELPKYTFAAYGSSITHGSCAISAQLNYVSQTARLVGAQALNKGLGGTCFAEKEAADYITDLEYDFLLYEIGSNMYFGFSEQETYDRGKYLIEKHFEKNPDKYLFLIEPLLSHEKYKSEEKSIKYHSFMDKMRQLHKDINNEKCILIPADVVQDKRNYIACDGLHPSTEGHMAMGINVANVIKKYIK